MFLIFSLFENERYCFIVIDNIIVTLSYWVETKKLFVLRLTLDKFENVWVYTLYSFYQQINYYISNISTKSTYTMSWNLKHCKDKVKIK